MFGADTITYLKDLGANNSKDWFDRNRARYEDHYLAPAREFVEAVAPGLRDLALAVVAEPRVNGSIFRVNRDVRFSKDKTPYKPHIDLWFWEGERKGAVSGFFMRLAPSTLILGAGAHMLGPDGLKRYRTALDDGTARAGLIAALDAVTGAGLPLKGETMKRPPRGFEPPDERTAALSRHSAIWTDTEAPHPPALGTPAFVDHCLGVWARAEPLHRWLIDNLA